MFKLTRILLLGGVVGKVLGILRELLAACLFGTGNIASAYRVAQSGFLLPLHALVSDTLTVAFIPAYSKKKATDPAAARLLFSSLHVTLLAVSSIVAVLLWMFSDRWVRLLAPGFGDEASRLASVMTKVLALSMPCYVLTALYSALDLVRGSGRLTAFRATAQSAGLILGSLAAYAWDSPALIALGFSIAYILLAERGMRIARQEGLHLFPGVGEFKTAFSVLLELWGSFRVLIWLPVVAQIASIIERQTASFVHPGANAGLDYARFISETSIVLVAIPFGSAALAAMSQMQDSAFKTAALFSTRLLLFIGVPLSCGCALHARIVVKILFSRGAFDAESVSVTTCILGGLAVGLCGNLVGYAGAKFLNARGANRMVLLLSVAATSVAVAINLLFRGLGPQVLGLSAAAYGTIFGLLVLWRLEIVGALLSDFASLVVPAILYAAAVQWFIPELKDRYLMVVTTLAFFLILSVAVPRNRRFLTEAFHQFYKA